MPGFLPCPRIFQRKGKAEENRRRKVLCGKNPEKDQWRRSGAYPGKERCSEKETTQKTASGKDVDEKEIYLSDRNRTAEEQK